MGLQFRSRLTACIVADQAIFLDIERDRYFSVAGAGAQAMEALFADRPPPPIGLAQLTGAGLIVESNDNRLLTPATMTIATRSLVEEAQPRSWPPTAPVLDVAVRLARTHWQLKKRSLAAILDQVSARRSVGLTSSNTPSGHCLEIASNWLAARRVVPITPRCLPDSLALLDRLARYGFAADLVFGVKLNPFSAHCWVQVGDTLLNEAVDHAAVHTPILVA